MEMFCGQLPVEQVRLVLFLFETLLQFPLRNSNETSGDIISDLITRAKSIVIPLMGEGMFRNESAETTVLDPGQI